MASGAVAATTFHRFLDLPPELRVEVYRHVFGHREILWIVDDGRDFVMTNPKWPNSLFDTYVPKDPVTPLMRTCKSVYQESRPFIFDKMLFRTMFSVAYDPPNRKVPDQAHLMLASDAIEQITQQMRHVELVFGMMSSEISPHKITGSFEKFLELVDHGRGFKSFSVYVADFL